MTTLYTVHESPLGPLLLARTDRGLTGIYFEGQKTAPRPASALCLGGGIADPFATVRRALDAYFEGDCTRFDLLVDAPGSDFQRTVWKELESIPFAQTRSYGALAKAIGNGNASRAVGAANGKNPIAIVIPCHRVIGSSGALTGYAGGSDRKRWLLDHEARVAARTRRVVSSLPSSRSLRS